jgi:YD repeat-containing protein
MKALLVLLAASSSAMTAMAADADLLRCRTIADVARRVTCYDAIPLPPSPAPTPAVTTTTSAVSSAANASDASFGLSARQMRKPAEPDAIESSLVGHIDGWGPTTQFRLANGQVWRVTDDSSGYVTEADNPKIKITRNALGTIFLEIEGSKQAPRVRRLQ